jgi:hypothetical protein
VNGIVQSLLSPQATSNPLNQFTLNIPGSALKTIETRPIHNGSSNSFTNKAQIIQKNDALRKGMRSPPSALLRQ